MSKDWELAEAMLKVWKLSHKQATGTPSQREISRMLLVLKYLREQENGDFNG